MGRFFNGEIMRIAISGAQCTGKSTVIEDLKNHPTIGTNFKFKGGTTRNILRDSFGIGALPINEDGTDATQLLICSQHLLNHITGTVNNTIYDRCTLDGLVYTAYLYEKKQVTKETMRIAESLFNNLSYDMIFYIPPELPIVDDGERSTSQQFQNEIVQLFDEYISSHKLPVGILSGTREERVKTVETAIQLFNEHVEQEDAIFTELDDKLKDGIAHLKDSLENYTLEEI